jgi:hypothetical protein
MENKTILILFIIIICMIYLCFTDNNKKKEYLIDTPFFNFSAIRAAASNNDPNFDPRKSQRGIVEIILLSENHFNAVIEAIVFDLINIFPPMYDKISKTFLYAALLPMTNIKIASIANRINEIMPRFNIAISLTMLVISPEFRAKSNKDQALDIVAIVMQKVYFFYKLLNELIKMPLLLGDANSSIAKLVSIIKQALDDLVNVFFELPMQEFIDAYSAVKNIFNFVEFFYVDDDTKIIMIANIHPLARIANLCFSPEFKAANNVDRLKMINNIGFGYSRIIVFLGIVIKISKIMVRTTNDISNLVQSTQWDIFKSSLNYFDNVTGTDIGSKITIFASIIQSTMNNINIVKDTTGFDITSFLATDNPAEQLAMIIALNPVNKAKQIITDNGLNIVGAKNEIQKMLRGFQSAITLIKDISEFLQNKDRFKPAMDLLQTFVDFLQKTLDALSGPIDAIQKALDVVNNGVNIINSGINQIPGLRNAVNTIEGTTSIVTGTGLQTGSYLVSSVSSLVQGDTQGFVGGIVGAGKTIEQGAKDVGSKIVSVFTSKSGCVVS